MEKVCAVYIMTNKNHTVLYTGVTSNLPKRVFEHKNHLDKNSFTAKYNCEKLVWYEITNDMTEAIKREKQIKAGSRKKKEMLIQKMNPEWKDLYDEIL